MPGQFHTLKARTIKVPKTLHTNDTILPGQLHVVSLWTLNFNNTAVILFVLCISCVFCTIFEWNEWNWIDFKWVRIPT